MRPGLPPPPRRPRRPLGPTPRYQSIPRWGLIDRIDPLAAQGEQDERKGATTSLVRVALLGASAVFAMAAAAHILRYLLLLINRTMLLPPFIAIGSLLTGVVISFAAVVAVIVTAAVLTSWLIGRRAAAFGHHGQDDPRPEWALWAGCMIPIVNLVWAPVFLIELAHAERIYPRQRGPITMWWIAWIVSTAISAWAIWTSSATEPQAVADNTVTMIIAYLAGLAVLLLLYRVLDGFVRKPVDRPAHRWVIVAEDPAAARPQAEAADEPQAEAADEDESPEAVESKDREPAA
ncbi:MAG: DUF4328 domain-containing protein [Mycobacterium sp.]